jgi:hypothetical protein
MTVQELLKRLTKIAQKVKPVRNLNGVWWAFPCPFGIGSGAIPTNDLYTWVSEQPVFKRFGLAVRQQINRDPFFKINQDGSIGPPTPEREVINS